MTEPPRRPGVVGRLAARSRACSLAAIGGALSLPAAGYAVAVLAGPVAPGAGPARALAFVCLLGVVGTATLAGAALAGVGATLDRLRAR